METDGGGAQLARLSTPVQSRDGPEPLACISTMEWIEAGRAGRQDQRRPSNAASRGTRRCLNSLQGWCDGEEERVARGRSPSPCASYGYGAKRNHCERARDRSDRLLRGQRRAVPPPAVSHPAVPRPKAYVRIPGRGAVAPPRPRRMNRRRAASSPQPQAMHSRSKKRMEHPPVLRGRALMRRTVRCVCRVAMGHTVFRVLLPCHGLESSL